MSWATDADAAIINNVLKIYDHKPKFVQTKAPATTLTVMGHKRNFKSNETEYVNAYGAHGCEFILRASDFTVPPEKFDSIELDGEIFNINDVKITRGFNNTVLLYHCLCKGI